MKREADGTRFRLLGVGITNLTDAAGADPASLIDRESDKRAAAERAMDSIRGQIRRRQAVKQGPRAFEQSRPRAELIGSLPFNEIPMPIIDARLKELGITLPAPPSRWPPMCPSPSPAIWCSSPASCRSRTARSNMSASWAVDFSVEEGQAAAQLCAINMLAQC